MPSQAYDTPGSFSFVCPSGVANLIMGIAKGSGAGGSTSTPNATPLGAAGAGAGGYAEQTVFPVTPGETLDVIVAAGGGPDSDGGVTSIMRGVTSLCSADGGKASVDGITPGVGGAGLVGSDLEPGGDGGNGDTGGGGGGGGGGADEFVPGTVGSNATAASGGAGGAGNAVGGNGGDLSMPGGDGTGHSAGGGGGGGDTTDPFPGGVGGPGRAQLDWSQPPSVSSCSPPSGSTLGGDVVDVLGSLFQSGATVDFGTGPQAATWINSGRLRLTTPPGTAGPKTVIVVNADLNFGSKANAFTFISSTVPSTLGPAINKRRRR